MEYPGIPQENVLQWIKDNYVGKKVTDSRSPAGNWLNFTLESIEEGNAVLLVEVRHEMTNPYGNIHGGMMSLIIDESIGWAVASLANPNHYTSMSLNIDFLFSIKNGDSLKAIAKVVREGKRIVNVDCHVYNSEGALLARGTSNLITTSMQFV